MENQTVLNILRSMPLALVIMRFLIGVIIFAYAKNKSFQKFFLAFFIVGFFSDFLDGFIARRVGHIPRIVGVLDGYADITLYISTLYFLLKNYSDSLRKYRYYVFGLIGLILISWLFCYLKFGKLTSYHPYSAKLFGISIFLFVAGIYILKKGIFFPLLIIFGLLNISEEIAITYVMPYYRVSISSIKEAIKLADAYNTKHKDMKYEKK